jgi:type I restriction enzyme S subunit
VISRYPMSLLADVCEVFADGDWVESKDQSQAGIRLIQTGNVGIGAFKGRDEKARYVSDGTFNRLRCTEIFEGDCLISRLPEPAGRSCIVPATGERMITAVDCTIVRFRPRQVHPEFFNYYSQSLDYLKAVDSETTGTTRKRISRSNLGQVAIPVPPVPEQQRIVGILDEAFAAIATTRANTEQNLRNARVVFEGYLNAVFAQSGVGWVERPLIDLCHSTRGITYGVVKLGNETAEGVPCLRTSNVRWLRIETEGMKRIAPALSSQYSRTILKGGEVLVNVRGTLGGVAVATPEMAGWNVSREVAVVPVDSSCVNPEFLSYLIGSGVSQEWLGGVKTGATYVGINIEDLRLLPVNAPGMSEQLAVVRHLKSLNDESDRLASVYQRKLAALDALKQSLLHQAFTGAL